MKGESMMKRPTEEELPFTATSAKSKSSEEDNIEPLLSQPLQGGEGVSTGALSMGMGV